MKSDLEGEIAKKVIEIYLRRWDIEVNHREMKGKG